MTSHATAHTSSPPFSPNFTISTATSTSTSTSPTPTPRRIRPRWFDIMNQGSSSVTRASPLSVTNAQIHLHFPNYPNNINGNNNNTTSTTTTAAAAAAAAAAVTSNYTSNNGSSSSTNNSNNRGSRSNRIHHIGNDNDSDNDEDVLVRPLPPSVLAWLAQSTNTITSNGTTPSTSTTSTPSTTSTTSNNNNDTTTWIRDFVNKDKISPNLYCAICCEIFSDPLRTDCGHIFCKKCITEWLAVSNTCPQDRNVLTKNKIFFDQFAANIVGELTVYCPYKQNGCDWTDQLHTLSHHIKSCPNSKVPCVYGCGVSLLRADRDFHLQNCTLRPVACTRCGVVLQHYNLDAHKISCPEEPIPCMYLCGEFIRRREVDAHIVVCNKVRTGCPHRTLGCRYECERQEIQSHLTSCHYEAVKDVLYDMQKRIRDLERVVEIIYGANVNVIIQNHHLE